VIARDSEQRPLALLPFSMRQGHSVRTACFMGGKHTTFNMGLWNAEFAAQAVAADLDTLFAPLRDQVDVLALTQQPKRWNDQQNPFALLPQQSAVNGCPLLVTEPDGPPSTRISNSFRRRLKSKEKKLQALAGYRYHPATTDADVIRLLDWFFRVKPARMAEQRLPNVFAEPGVEQFIRSACLAPRGEGRVIDIHALECDDDVIAIFAGVADGQRFSMMFNTYTMSEHARYSPGLILIRYIIDRYAERGYRWLDLGIGSDDYKRMFCKDDEDIFDSFIPLTSRGKLAAMAMSSLNHGKRLVKQNQMLFDLARRLRQALG
jgi:CelD/BcsL family acetyltransferase involved in cellulose biosynthesis